MGLVANLVNYLVQRKLPDGAKQTEVVDNALRLDRERLRAETHELLHELINKPALRGTKNGPVHK